MSSLGIRWKGYTLVCQKMVAKRNRSVTVAFCNQIGLMEHISGDIMSTALAALLKPFEYKSLKLRNRVAMAPMTRNFSPGYVPDDNVAGYYRRRAEGEVGLLITEGTTVGHPAANGYPQVPAFHGEAALKGWRNVVEQVHQAGGSIIPQIWHVGSVRRPGGPLGEYPAHSPSGLFKPGKQNGHVMTTEDIHA